MIETEAEAKRLIEALPRVKRYWEWTGNRCRDPRCTTVRHGDEPCRTLGYQVELEGGVELGDAIDWDPLSPLQMPLLRDRAMQVVRRYLDEKDEEDTREIEATLAHLLAPRFRLISPWLLNRICDFKTINAAWVCGGRVMVRLCGNVDFVAIGPLPHPPARS